MRHNDQKLVPLHYPGWLRLVAAGLIALPLGAAWLVWGSAEATDEWQNALPYVVLCAWLALTYQVFLVEVYYDERGLTYISPLAGMVRLHWNEIVSVVHVRLIDGYIIESDDGRRIWFHEWRSGMDDVAAAIQSRLPRQARGGH